MFDMEDLISQFLCPVFRVSVLLVLGLERRICISNKVPDETYWTRAIRVEAERLLGGNLAERDHTGLGMYVQWRW